VACSLGIVNVEPIFIVRALPSCSTALLDYLAQLRLLNWRLL
jgi:hypothetical protein